MDYISCFGRLYRQVPDLKPLSRIELVSTNDVAVFRSRDGTLSDEGALVKLKHQNLLNLSILCFEISRKNYKRIYSIKKVVFP